jgi:hypothetical protein
MKSSGNGPVTFRCVAQNLNHCATAVPDNEMGNVIMKTILRVFVACVGTKGSTYRISVETEGNGPGV